MSYHSLSECSLTDDERRAEATRILGMIGDQMRKEMQAHEAAFVRRKANLSEPVSVKELFWLRDLNSKYNP
jgi:hypothetical protein